MTKEEAARRINDILRGFEYMTDEEFGGQIWLEDIEELKELVRILSEN